MKKKREKNVMLEMLPFSIKSSHIIMLRIKYLNANVQCLFIVYTKYEVVQ